MRLQVEGGKQWIVLMVYHPQTLVSECETYDVKQQSL